MMDIRLMNMREIDLNLLLVFEAIYTAGNISRAADQLDLSQPALSNALARLRKQLDDQLFVRSGNGVVPTSRAEEMISPVRQALDAIRQGLLPADKFDPNTSERHFSMIVADPLESVVMAGIVSSLRPDTRLSFEMLPPQIVQVEDALLNFSLDLSVFLLPSRQSELNSVPLCPVDIVFIAREGHPRIHGKFDPDVFQNEKWVGLALKPGKLKNTEKLTVWQRVEKQPIVLVNKANSIAHIVAKTDMIGFVSSVYAKEFSKMLGLQVIRPPMPVSNQNFHMTWHKRYDDDAGHKWLRDRVAESIRQITP
ncbi:LysR family transcriptional regulator [Hoeflea sp.]|uniref:LysR family transcriptional regulator n=1 Tax=Hoeflea sp. TaxID=1940281 RepID=UPI003A9317B6